jgi:hypothetical protein
VLFVITMFCSLCVVTTCPAITNALSNYMTSYVDGSDGPGIRVLDEVGQIQYLRMRTFTYPDYNANPMYQDIYNAVYGYDPAITCKRRGKSVTSGGCKV